MRFNTNTIKFLITVVAILFINSCNQSEVINDRRIISPYSEINWDQVGHYDAMFHVHPGLGAEEYDPHDTIDRYYDEGYRILAFSPHDYDVPDDYIESLYPWTRFSEIYEIIKHVENPTEENQTYEEFANNPYENRDPVELGMVSIQGSEISGQHHIVSLFSDFTDSAESEIESFQIIEELDGIAYFAHPGRYIDRWGLTAYWYVDLYLRTNADVVFGQSVYNRVDNHPGDRAFFDKIAHILGHDRPIWMVSEDDMHTERTLGWNRNVILLENFEPGSMHPDIQNGSAPDVKKALIDGRFYLWKPSEQYNRRAFNINDVTINDKSIELRIDNPELVNEIRWITHNPEINDSETIQTGLNISLDQIPVYSKFVRAELEGGEGTIYTQPFYLR